MSVHVKFAQDLVGEVIDRIDYSFDLPDSKHVDNAIACFLADMDEMAMNDSDGPDLYTGAITPEMNRSMYESALRTLRPHLMKEVAKRTPHDTMCDEDEVNGCPSCGSHDIGCNSGFAGEEVMWCNSCGFMETESHDEVVSLIQ